MLSYTVSLLHGTTADDSNTMIYSQSVTWRATLYSLLHGTMADNSNTMIYSQSVTWRATLYSQSITWYYGSSQSVRRHYGRCQ